MRFVSGLLCLLLLGACQQKEAFAPEDNKGLQLASNVSIFESKTGQQQWVLTAEAVDFADLQNATLKNPVLLLKQDGQDAARITANTGQFDYTNKLVTLSGNTKLVSLTEQATITTDRFFYDVDKDRVWSDGRTVISRGTGQSVARGGIETDSKLTKIELKQHRTRLPKTAQELKK